MNKKFFFVPFTLLIITLTPQAFAEYENTIVVMETEMGRLIIEFFPDVAPNHVENFVTLSENGYYTGTIFHRVIEGFMIQGGDPKTADPSYSLSEWGTGDPGYSIDAEFNNIQHKRGIVSMARSADPNSAGSQFFIVHNDSNFLDGQYTVFGRILTDESFETLDKIATLPTAPNDQPVDAWKAIVKNVQVLDRSEAEWLKDISSMPLMAPVTEKEIESIDATHHNFKELGISFTSPAGWLVQTPAVTSSTSPQIAIVGPKTDSSMPAISFRMDPSTKTLDEEIVKFKQTIEPLIQSGVLVITGDSKGFVNDYDSYVLKADGNFEDKNEVEQNIGFAAVLMKHGNVLYVSQYTNYLDSFTSEEPTFIEILTSIELFTPQPLTSALDYGQETSEISNETSEISNETLETLENNDEGGGCLIATAAFGSEMAPQVQFLREIRDNTVMSTQSGTAFMAGFNQFYYSFSPYVADYERENPVFKEAVKITLTPMLTSLTLLNHVNVDTEEEMLGYGISIILLNIGMYFVAPAAAIIVIKNRINRN